MDEQQLRELVNAYQPDPELLSNLKAVRLLMTLGPSGAGKTTLARASGLGMVLGDAARPPRDDEQNGVDYWFRSEADMVRDAQLQRYVQIAIGSGGDLKGTRVSSFPAGQAVFAVVAAAIKTFRALPFAETRTAVIVPPDYTTWMRRMASHELSAQARQTRLGEARSSYEFALSDKEALFVLNDSLEAGTRRLLQAANGATPDDNDRARTIVANLLAQLQTEGLR